MSRIAAMCLVVGLAGPAGAQMLVEDFATAPETRWRFVSDQVMGGVSVGQAQIGTDPAHIHLTGDVSTRNSGGFIQVRRDVDPWPADTQAIVLKVKGDGQKYFVALRTSDFLRPWHSYRASFVALDDWADVTIPIAAFAPSREGIAGLDLTRLTSIGVLAYGRDHIANLRVARISLR